MVSKTDTPNNLHGKLLYAWVVEKRLRRRALQTIPERVRQLIADCRA